MKSRLRVPLLVLCIAFSILFISCSYTNRIWREWEPWSEWRQGAVTESRNVVITSQPEGARVYSNGVLTGNTPTTLSLSCPILKSERTRIQEESFTPGVIEYLLLFSRPITSPVSSEKEERTRTGSQIYGIELRKEGYISVKRNFSVPETSVLFFTLKRKPTLFIKPFKIKNNLTLSTLQRLFNALYGKRFGVDTSKFTDMDRRYLFPTLMEVFEISSDKYSQYVLEGEIIIERDATEICFLFSEASGRLVAAKKVLVETKHLDNLHQKIEPIIKSIVDAFLNQD